MSVPFDMLLHPELLSNEQLICIIQERHLRVPNIGYMRRDELLDIFHNFCVPYGQRKYRDSGRGRVLNKTRQPSPEPTMKLNVMIVQENVRNKTDPKCERLKPPPECWSGQTKRIKIETMISPLPNTDILRCGKRRITFDSMAVASDSPPQKKERKPITWP